MNHTDIYEKCSRPGHIPPGVGDKIRLNYGTGLEVGYIVASITEDDEGFHLIVHPPGETRSKGYLNRYRILADGRMVSGIFLPGSAGHDSNGGGRNGDGRDEILIEDRAAQGRLF